LFKNILKYIFLIFKRIISNIKTIQKYIIIIQKYIWKYDFKHLLTLVSLENSLHPPWFRVIINWFNHRVIFFPRNSKGIQEEQIAQVNSLISNTHRQKEVMAPWCWNYVLSQDDACEKKTPASIIWHDTLPESKS